MMFYEVWVKSPTYRSSEALTYQYASSLAIGTIVKVSLQKADVWAVITKKVNRPAFNTKPILVVSAAKPLPTALLTLADQLARFYAAPLGGVTQLLLPADPPLAGTSPPTAEPVSPTPLLALPTLTPEQTVALERCVTPGTHLLHGKTGTGKTRVYIELAQKMLAADLSSIILTPEISLTSQLSQRFRDTFGDRVVLVHSGLTQKERREAWQTINSSTHPLVIVGARSALFSPLQQIGLIVVDEAHEPAYKQEQAPYYHAVRVASMLAKIHNASLVLGTATPSVSDYFLAEQKHAGIVTMNELATHSQATTRREIVNLTDRSLFSRSPLFSQPLIEAMQASLARHEQSLLYLNRRGTARIILCDQCGWQAACPHCDLPLTYHADNHAILCHSCNFHGKAPLSCPQCGNASIIYKSPGTKSIVDEVTRLFPEARVQRFDTDNLKADRLEQHYEAIHRGDVDILVGTQLLAKGLDLPKLSTLGVIVADSSLAIPDFSSVERTYQLLSQVLGRVGRGHINSTAIIQTYNADSVAIQAATNDDWETFYRTELEEREKFNFPPFYFLLKLSCKRASAKAAEKATMAFKETLEKSGLPIRIEGPAPSFHERTAGKYEWQLVVKSRRRSALLNVITQLPSSGWSYDIDPINLL